MALPPLVDLASFTTWPGVQVPDQRAASAEAVLVQASALVRSYTGQTWLDEAGNLGPVPDEVAGVVLQVASRVWNNPLNASSRTTGPNQIAFSVTAGLALADDEKALLNRHRVAGRSGGLTVLGTTRSGFLAANPYVGTLPGPSGQGFPFLEVDDSGEGVLQ